MSHDIEKILNGYAKGERLDDDDALSLLKSSDLLALGQAAHQKRMAIKPEPVVTYIIDRNINYSNLCVTRCRFCAFYKAAGDEEGYTLGGGEIAQKIEETIKLGGRQILLQGGHHPSHTIEWYEHMIGQIKSRFDIHVHGFSPPEIIHISGLSKITVAETIGRLKKAGLNSIPGGGAEILSDRVRSLIAPQKCSASAWIDVMRTAHQQGMRTTATMMFGHEETLAERVESLKRIRNLQDETDGFTAFIPWPFQPENTKMDYVSPAGGFEYLKTLAVSRLYLDNIDNIQASWVTQGPKVAQMALFFGANDMGSTMIEENVVQAAGVSFRMSEKDIRKAIEETGMTPQRRNMIYEPVG
ncbi:Cyclic dehypoxanthine futalosine synthase [hydrothermal vent metagenome]|uniref:Cyclic dehypoxanthine futalosine synthase n=1 Tax=hydrothermal vent metagenome TaxID=652676 RepID=A0A3B1C8A3_9ZZZZ